MTDTRAFWLKTMTEIAAPVLEPLSNRQFKSVFPISFNLARAPFAPLEAFARTFYGIAPWLELECADTEQNLRKQYRKLLLEGIDAATDPASPDKMVFSGEIHHQPLVDAAILCQGLLRTPQSIAAKLEDRVRANLVTCLKQTRALIPNFSNWLLFSAMVEAGLSLLGEKDIDMLRVALVLRTFMKWYVGDGAYGDGEQYHHDYYNSYVIHPMLIDLLGFFQSDNDTFRDMLATEKIRAARYAAVLESQISPEGAYPMTGRSIVYRFGAFQSLSQAAYLHFLPNRVIPAQARCALTSVIKRTVETGIFDENGYLLPGVCGRQPSLCEEYINIGSLYNCCAAFLPLGLPEDDPFWGAPDALWTSAAIYAGHDIPADHRINM